MAAPERKLIAVRIPVATADKLERLSSSLTGQAPGQLVATVIEQFEPYMDQILAGLEEAEKGNIPPILRMMAATSRGFETQLSTLRQGIEATGLAGDPAGSETAQADAVARGPVPQEKRTA